jgi:colicin import membrane protein
MANTPAYSYEEFANAADKIQSSGKKPTVRGIRAALGNTGGHELISKYLHRWHDENGRLDKIIDQQLDPSISKAINLFLACKINEAKVDATAQIRDLQKESDDLNLENESLAYENTLKTDSLSSQIVQNNVLTGRVQQLIADVERNASELIKERHKTEVVRMALAKAEQRLEYLSSINGELEKVRGELIQYQLKAAELKGQLSLTKSDVN